MTRLTLGNVVKVAAVLVFLPLLAYLVLVIGTVRKHLATTLEGVVYAGAFSAAAFVLDAPWGVRVLLALVATGASGVRAWHLRDLWLPARRRWWKREPAAAVTVVTATPSPRSAPVETTEDLHSALARVRVHASRNRRSLPGDAFPTVVRICDVLDAVIVSEEREPTRDARFEYELDAMVRQYLPSVLTSYLAIAPGRVHERQADGRTPAEELAEQLRILAAQADSLDASRQRRLTADLSTSGNFLRDKYGQRQQDAFDLRAQ